MKDYIGEVQQRNKKLKETHTFRVWKDENDCWVGATQESPWIQCQAPTKAELLNVTKRLLCQALERNRMQESFVYRELMHCKRKKLGRKRKQEVHQEFDKITKIVWMKDKEILSQQEISLDVARSHALRIRNLPFGITQDCDFPFDRESFIGVAWDGFKNRSSVDSLSGLNYAPLGNVYADSPESQDILGVIGEDSSLKLLYQTESEPWMNWGSLKAERNLHPLLSAGFPNIIRDGFSIDSIRPLVPGRPYVQSPGPPPTISDEVHEDRIPTEQRNVPLLEIISKKTAKKVLIVGGFADDTNQIVARFIEQLGFEAIILSEQPNGGRTKFEKFKAYTNVDFVITLLTPDDVGRTKDNPYDELKPRPSQDTIFGLGYLCNHLRPEQMCTLYTEKIELPSLLEGYIHLSICSSDSWKLKLIKEMKFAGLRIDGNKLLRT